MISHLFIKDFALIEEITIDFEKGLNIFTGETGSGKSIIVEAISLALGSRADTTYIKTGKNKSIVEVIIDECNLEAKQLLDEKEIGLEDNQVIFRREISLSGKNLCKINNCTVPLSFFQKVSNKLVDIHGQYDNQSLLNSDNHIEFLDKYSTTSISDYKNNVYALYNKFTKLSKELHKIEANSSQNARNIDFIKFEIDEIDSAELKINEDIELKDKILLLQNSEKIFLNLNTSYDIMYENSPSVLQLLKNVKDSLQDLSSYNSSLENCYNKFDDAYYTIEDIIHEISLIKDSLDFSPSELDFLLERLDTIDKLKIKYGNSIEEILDYRHKISMKLDTIENIDDSKIKIELELKKCKDELLSSCKVLSDLRKESALKLEKEISKQLSELNFSESIVNISFFSGVNHLSDNGYDKIEFLISTNKGETLKPLAKVASGGEISRLMLAFKNILGDLDSIPTLIFDEIDTGISGITASVVGKKLVNISLNHQVFCITHLPQIAAFGNQNYKISKQTNSESTSTILSQLHQEDKINEIARMLGGETITKNTLDAAKDLINMSLTGV